MSPPAEPRDDFLPIPAVVEEIRTETPTIRTFCLRPERPIPFRAGQFMQLGIPGTGEAPFTPSSSPFEADRMEITILRAGYLTDALHRLAPGATVGLRGPFGKGYPVDRFRGKQVLVVGGGVGLAPLRALLHVLFREIHTFARVSIKYGARTPAELCFRDSYEDWGRVPGVDFTPAIDRPAPGWSGRVGLVTTLLDGLDLDLAETFAVSCGPEVMLKFVTWKLLDIGLDPERICLSMNRNMSCGMGLCGRCNVGTFYLCKDGPDMCYAEIKDIPHVLG